MKREPLDFTDQPALKQATLMEVVSVIVRHYGEQGCTMEDVAGTVQKNCPQWKPASCSPCVSGLEKLGCVRTQSIFGVRHIYHVRDYDRDVDRAELTRIEAAAVAARQAVKAGTLVPPQPAAKAGPASSVKMLFAIGENKTEALTVEDARALYEQLHAIFGKK